MSAQPHDDDLVVAVDAPGIALHQQHEHRGVKRLDLVRLAGVSLAAAAVWVLGALPSLPLQLFGSAVLLVGSWPVLREAVENLLERRMTMELSMTIALAAALVTGEVFVALVIAGFVLAAEILEGLALSRGHDAIRDLLAYLPPVATVRHGDGTRDVPLAEVRPGDVAVIRPGERIPIDGHVVLGSSHVDEATITGEPMPVLKVVGDAVFAGTLNQLGALDVRVAGVGRDTTFGRIVAAVEDGERSQAPIQKVADRYAGYLVVFALVAAIVTALVTRDPTATISVIIVAGACGIAAGTPLAILGGIGRAARKGAIVKGGRHLEALWDLDTVVLDKTGTLTFGTPTVVGVHPVAGVPERELLRAAATAEARSEHPLGRAIVAHATATGVDAPLPETFQAQPGNGVRAEAGGQSIIAGARAYLEASGIDTDSLSERTDGRSEVAVASGGRLLGTIAVADVVRPEAPAAVAALRELGIRTVLLSGDRSAAAASVARALEVDEFHGELLPEAKQAFVRRLVADDRCVAMVGDGVNDAPALVEATVGIAMGSGTDVARDTADVLLIGDDLGRLVDTIRLARKARGLIRQNFGGTIAIDSLGIALAFLGVLGPLLAAFIHVASELTFILNSARMLPRGRVR